MVLGTVLVLAALSLFIMNQRENQKAERFAQETLPKVMERIEARKKTIEEVSAEESNCPDPYDPAMTEMEIDGYSYIGYLTIPALDIELPVMSTWDYTRLEISPCRYYGSTKSDDLVICAHNYDGNFGSIRNLTAGDPVYFMDMDGKVWKYQVTEVDILPPNAVETMIEGDYDLTLFTCTYGGASRVTVRCERVDNKKEK